MGSANQATSQHLTSAQTGNSQMAGDGKAAAARTAALRARIRELDLSCDEGTAKAPDTQPASTTEIIDSQFADSSYGNNSTGIGTLPAAPSNAPQTTQETTSRARWHSTFPKHLGNIATADQPNAQTLKNLIRLTPVWLISAVFHVLLLVALALLTYSQTKFTSPIIIANNQAEPEIVPELAHDVEIGDLNSDGVREEPLQAPVKLDPGPLDIELRDELSAPELFLKMTASSALAEQLDAAQKLQGDGSRKRGNDGTGARFYGIQAQGDRFVFIVDSSTSMRAKFADAKRELEYAVRGLGRDQLFYVIFFDTNTERLRLGKWNSRGTRFSLKTRSEPNLVPASNENINSLVYWMNTIQLDSSTNPHPAVAYTLRKLKPDAIFLLSDGEFTEGGATEALLQSENHVDHPTDGMRPKSIVHCVGFYSRHGEIALKRIAEDNGGTYRFVEPPRGIFISPAIGARRPIR